MQKIIKYKQYIIQRSLKLNRNKKEKKKKTIKTSLVQSYIEFIKVA